MTHWTWMFNRRSVVACVLGALLLAGMLPAAVYAQSAQPTGNGHGHGAASRHPMKGGHMMGGMHARGMHSMGARRAAAAASLPSIAGVPAQSTLPAASAPAVAADPARGRQLVLANGCLGCHSLNPAQRMVGPTWHDLAETAAGRVPGQSAEEYLYASIVQPNAYVVAGYRPNIMVQSYGQQLGEDRIAAIVSYLLTLHDED